MDEYIGNLKIQPDYFKPVTIDPKRGSRGRSKYKTPQRHPKSDEVLFRGI